MRQQAQQPRKHRLHDISRRIRLPHTRCARLDPRDGGVAHLGHGLVGHEEDDCVEPVAQARGGEVFFHLVDEAGADLGAVVLDDAGEAVEVCGRDEVVVDFAGGEFED